MSPEDAPKLNHGKLDFNRDVMPLLEEKKSKWKAKLHRLQSDKEKISQDLIQLDIKIRNMESEKTSQQAFITSQAEDFSTDPSSAPYQKRMEYERMIQQRDSLISEIAGLAKSISEKLREITEA